MQLKMLKSVQKSIKLIVSSKSTFDEVIQSHYLNGTFKKLGDKKLLTGLLFPGASSEVLTTLPKDLREVLSWTDLELDLFKIAKNATDVLNSIQAKGAVRGDIMDPETESVLLPQIAQEALANGILEAVRNLNRKVSSTIAKLTLKEASPEDFQGDLDQLDNQVVKDLFSTEQLGVQTEFMGPEWADAILVDIERYCRDENLTAVDKLGCAVVEERVVQLSDDDDQPSAVLAPSFMSWVELGPALTSTYPALAELVQQMHKLPHELNGEADADDNSLHCDLTLSLQPRQLPSNTRRGCSSRRRAALCCCGFPPGPDRPLAWTAATTTVHWTRASASLALTT